MQLYPPQNPVAKRAILAYNGPSNTRMIAMPRFWIIIMAAWAITMASIAAPAAVTAYRLSESAEKVRFVLEMTEKPTHKIFRLSGPERIVVDIQKLRWQAAQSQIPANIDNIIKVRHGIQPGDVTRVVLETKTVMKVVLVDIIPPRDQHSYRLVIDMVATPSNLAKLAPPAPKTPPIQQKILPTKKQDTLVVEALTPPSSQIRQPVYLSIDGPISKSPLPVTKPASVPIPALQEPTNASIRLPEVATPSLPIPTRKPGKLIASVAPAKHKPVIVIDAGHGGEDAGTIGSRLGIYEKDVTLQYALALQKDLQRSGKFDVVLTRNKDVYVPLKERVNKARKVNGDLFISLHADSNPILALKGLSVYTLSETASDTQTAALATLENKEMILHGKKVHSDSDEVGDILLDLVRRDTNNVSAQFAFTILKELKPHVKTLPTAHRFAGFAVLKGIDVPAVLVELGYLSNQDEERALISKAHKEKIISGLKRAIYRHFDLPLT
jgi:N-acetylmuramoyl-L-alanine amidase